MSLFEDFSNNDLIKKPTSTYTYLRELKKKNQEEGVKTEKELRKEMREKLSPEEYRKRYRKHHYETHKEESKIWYKTKKEKADKIKEEVISECRSKEEEKIDYDKYYTKKYWDDDTSGNRYRFARWSSRLKRIPWWELSRQHLPFRISDRNGIDAMMKITGGEQLKAYKFLLPHLEEIRDCPISLQKRQQPYKYPIYLVGEPLRSLANSCEINNGHIFLVADAMRRGKYIPEEVYLGRNSFIFGDVVVTQSGHLFRIALEHNLKWLTPKNVERIHNERIERWKNKADKQPPIYMVGDAYLIKVPINKQENLYFITPT